MCSSHQDQDVDRTLIELLGAACRYTKIAIRVVQDGEAEDRYLGTQVP
jgi:hypothetical protein